MITAGSGDSLSGVMVALATPLTGEGDLDRAGLDRLVDRVVAAGVRAVCPVGSTGEGPRLSQSQRLLVVEEVARRLPSDVPLIPAAAIQDIGDGVQELELLAGLGAEAVLVAPPSYYPMTDQEIVRYYRRLADECPLPVLLYNIPSMTKLVLSTEAVGSLADHENIIGIKDSSRDMEYFQSVVYATHGKRFAVLTGSDTLLMASLQLGGHGAIAASANLVPELGCDLYRAVMNGDWRLASQLQGRLFRVVMACRCGIGPAGWKAALELVSVCGRNVASPAAPLSDEATVRLRGRLTDLELL